MAIIPGTNIGETLTGTNGDDTITALAGIDRLYGLAGADNLDGGLDGDYLVGGPGDDIMLGGAGDDVYYVDSAGDQITELANEGTDAVSSSVSVILGDNVENLYLTGTGAINGTGNALRNTIRDNAGINILAGGAGNDSYVVQNTGDQVIELANEGTDYVSSSASFTLGANIENLVLKGTANIDGTGNDRNNSLTGNTGINVLAGAAGNDHYYVQNTGAQVVEQANGGTDFVHTSVDFTLPGNVEHMYLTGTGDINGTGNALANTIRDNAGINILAGGAGNNSYVVQNTGDQVIELANAGTDYVSSSASSYTLGDNVENLVLKGAANIDGTGNGLNNSLTGNTGINVLAGGAGNNSYVVQNTGDQVIEQVDHGTTDYVSSSATFTLSANVEHLVLTGNGDIAGTGNELNNQLTGNSGNNVLNGGNGKDTLDGKAGDDILRGGADDDTYTVNNVGVDIVEDVGGGFDRVFSTVTFTLADHVENLTLSGGANIDGTGNAGSNSIIGNKGANVLDGKGGDDILTGNSRTAGSGDTLVGGLGDDTYYVNAVGTQVLEQTDQGTDSVFSLVSFTLGGNVENLYLGEADPYAGTRGARTGIGDEVGNLIVGSSISNVLDGRAGNDELHGGGGNDQLIGGAGNDELDGGDGVDTAVFSGSLANYSVTADINGVMTVADNVGNNGTDTLRNVEYLRFADRTIEAFRSGTSASETIVGTENSDNLFGNGGNDTLRGLGAADKLHGEAGKDTLVGGGANDSLSGGEGDDTLDGEDGVDTAIFSGSLFDYSISKNSATGVLTVTDNAGNDGTDTAIDVENLQFADHLVAAANVHPGTSASEAVDGTGGSDVLFGGGGNDTLSGFDSVDILDGGDGADTLIGGEGDDRMTGGSGNDALDGADLEGRDTMAGGPGNDTYTISESVDDVIEQANEGIDTVLFSPTLSSSSESFTLPDNVENLTLVTPGLPGPPLTGIGNELNNKITGSAHRDILLGAGGRDIFVFNQNPVNGNQENADTLSDFSSADDIMHLDSQIFTSLAPGALPEAAFENSQQATKPGTRIYRDDEGHLYYDFDGSGPGLRHIFATVPIERDVTAQDFFVI